MGAKAQQATLDGVNHDQIELVPATAFNNKNPHTIRFIDPNLTERQAIKRIQLPAKTMYLIDKVVRAKALKGPIGVNNSEVINIEMERQFKLRNRYLDNLAANGRDDDSDDDANYSEKLNADNEKLLQRLYKVA